MSCDVGNATEGLENELILQPSRHFTYATTHSPNLPSLYLRHSSFSNPSVASPTSQFILHPFFRFSYVTSSSLNSPGAPPMRSMSISAIEAFKCELYGIDWDTIFQHSQRICISDSFSLHFNYFLMIFFPLKSVKYTNKINGI